MYVVVRVSLSEPQILLAMYSRLFLKMPEGVKEVSQCLITAELKEMFMPLIVSFPRPNFLRPRCKQLLNTGADRDVSLKRDNEKQLRIADKSNNMDVLSPNFE